MALIRKHLVEEMKRRTGYDEKVCKIMLNAIVESIVEGCSREGVVKINGFGVFTRQERVINQSRTDKSESEVRRVMHFSPTKELKESGIE